MHMKANNNLTITPFLLKLVGGLLILVSLVEYIALLFPQIPFVSDPTRLSQALDQYWKIDFWKKLVETGDIPLIGMLLIFTGHWMASTLNLTASRSAVWKDSRLWASVLATVLGIAYLVTLPIYLNNVNFAKEESFKTIDTQSEAGKAEVNKQLQQISAQVQQYQTLAKDKAKLEQEIAKINQELASGQVQGNRLVQLNNIKANLETLKNNSQVLEQRNKEAQEEAKKELARIDKLQKDAKQSTASSALASGITTDLKSLLLAIAYTAIGWMGLRNVLTGSGSSTTVEKWE
jgi:ABC-type multidrug transport system fused ATPase/permease subunit